jgi:hypothetical protein
MNVSKNAPVFSIGSESVASRIIENTTGEYRKVVTGPDGTVEPAPSPLQVAAVLRALSDLSLNQLMLCDDVKSLGDERISDPDWREADGLGHFLSSVAETIEFEVKNKPAE